MKRMIDGIINYNVELGDVTPDSSTGTKLDITFYFPWGYYPLALSSKPFSIPPGIFKFGDQVDIHNYCFGETINLPTTYVEFVSGSLNDMGSNNYIQFTLTFQSTAMRDAFADAMLGKGAPKGENVKFATPVSMLLVKFESAAEY